MTGPPATGPVAVVTGGNRGIGLEVCRQLAARGFVVVLGSRDRTKGEAAAAPLVADGLDVRAAALDVTDAASVSAAAEWADRELSRVDVVINNAAILYDSGAHAVTADLDSVHRAMETNLFGAWRTVQAFLPLLRRGPHPRIVNVSSESGSLAAMSGGVPAYATSKAALNALTRLLAGELRRDRVLVNAVCPGWTDTDMGQGGRPVADGAASVVWAAVLSDDGPTGGFYRDGEPLSW